MLIKSECLFFWLSSTYMTYWLTHARNIPKVIYRDIIVNVMICGLICDSFKRTHVNGHNHRIVGKMIKDKICGWRSLEITFGITLLALMLLAGGAGAATLTVNASGGANYTRIQGAINASSAGDTILVYSGTYYENVNVYKQLILKGVDTGGGKPVVNSNGSASAIILSAGNSTLEEFNAVNTSGIESGIRVSLNNNVIRNNTASNNFYGIYLDYSSNNNTLSGNNAIS
jgi:parallel beta-helix repeat protein